MKFRDRNAYLAVIACTSILAGTANAQTAPQEAAAAAASDDIVVTARRTAERLQDVPVAVTAVTGQQLESLQIRNLTDVQRLSPSLSITPLNGASNSASIQIRGQVQTTAGIGVDPSTGAYLNEIYMARPAGLDAAIFDINSVQVLKGPQGTLFGRSSVGGAVLIETKRPTDSFGGYVSAALEDPWGYSLEGALNVPLGEGIGLRVAGLRQYIDGYTKVLNGNYRLDDRDRWAGRATLQAQLTDTLTTTFIGDYYRSSTNGPAFFAKTYNPALVNATTAAGAAYLTAFAKQQTLGFHEKESQFKPFNYARVVGIANITTWDASEGLTFKNITGGRWVKADDTADHDGTTATILSTRVTSNTKQFSEELQLQAKPMEGLDLIVGGYYFWETGYDHSNSYVRRAETSVARTQNRFTGTNTSASLFGQANYSLPIDIPAHIFAGIRRTRDKREITFENRNVNADGSFSCVVAGAPANCIKPAEKSFNATTWTFGFDIKPVEEAMLYGTVGRGYRSGGFNGRATSLPQQAPFSPEFVTSYELGIKSNWDLGGSTRLMFNAAAYTMDYTNIQRALVIISAGAPVSVVINTPSARIRGFELESTLRFGRDVSLGGFIGYTKPQYKKFIDNGVDRSNNKFTYVPKLQAGATLDATVYRSDRLGDFGFNLNYAYRSQLQQEIINFPGSVVDAYHLVNLSVRLENAFGSKASVEVYAKNLFDKDYEIGGFGAAGSVGVANVIHGAPRVVGVSLRVPFGND
jgi:iron complex outermembrane receptor protein